VLESSLKFRKVEIIRITYNLHAIHALSCFDSIARYWQQKILSKLHDVMHNIKYSSSHGT
jgi:hypothetical protein